MTGPGADGVSAEFLSEWNCPKCGKRWLDQMLADAELRAQRIEFELVETRKQLAALTEKRRMNDFVSNYWEGASE